MVRIKVMDVYFNYPSVQALKGVTFEIKPGSFIALVGPNGSGKTTLLKCLSGILSPYRGTVYLNQEDISRMRPTDVAKVVAILLTNVVETSSMKVFDVVANARYPYTGFFGFLRDVDVKTISKVMEMLKVDNLVDRKISELSDGQKQRVMLARALAQEPKVLLLDEPVSHLDLGGQVETLDLISYLSKEGNVTVIATFHDLGLASLYSDEVILMKDGKIVAMGNPLTVLTEDNIAEAYSVERSTVNRLMNRLGRFYLNLISKED